MGIFDSLFGTSQKTNTNSTGTQNTSTSNNFNNDPAYKAFLAGFNQQYTGAGNFNVPINPYQTGAANNQQGVTSNPALATGFTTAGNVAQNGFAPQMAAFQNPFESQVVGNMQSDFARQNAEQMDAIRGGAAKSGALGNNTGQNALLMRGAQDAQAKAIANTRMTGFNTAADLANRNATTQLAGVGQIGNLTGASTQANTAQFGMGQGMWEDAYKNARTPFDLYNQGMSGYQGAGNLAGTTTSGTTTGTQNSVTKSNPSFMQGLTGLAGLGMSGFDWMKNATNDWGIPAWAANGGVIKAKGFNDGGSVIPPFHANGASESFADKVARAHETVSKLRASGGRTESPKGMGPGRFAEQRVTGDPWKATVRHTTDAEQNDQDPFWTPYQAERMVSWPPFRPMQYEVAGLRGYDEGGSVLPEGTAPFPGFNQSNTTPMGPAFGGNPFAQFMPDGATTPTLQPETTGQILPFGGDALTSANIMEAYNPNGPPRVPTTQGEVIPTSTTTPNGPAAPAERRRMQPMSANEKFAAILMAASGPQVFGGAGKALLDMHQQRIAEHNAELQADQLAQQLAHQNATLGLQRDQLTETVAHRTTQADHQRRELDERTRHNQVTEDLGHWQARPDGSMINRRTGEVRESGIPSDVERRRAEAIQMGLDPNEPGFQQFVLTGKLGTQELNPTQTNILHRTREALVSAEGALGDISRAETLNRTAYDGRTAGARGAIQDVITLGGTNESQATGELGRLMTGQMLGNLKAIFGGNPSDGERKILADVEGSVNLPASQRAAILARARRLVEARMRAQRETIDALENRRFTRPRNPTTPDTTTGGGGNQPLIPPGSLTPLPNAPEQPEIGTILDGYRFNGGDPANKANWEKVN